MALSKKAIEFANFFNTKEQLLQTLKNDSDHEIAFKKSILFKSRRYNCLLSAKGVRLDPKTNEIIFVLGQKTGEPIRIEERGGYKDVYEVSIPLDECYEDIALSSGEAPRLLSKIRESVIDKYINERLDFFDTIHMFDNSCFDFTRYDYGTDWEERFLERQPLGTLSRDSKKRLHLVIRELDGSGDWEYEFDKLRLYQIQELGEHLEKVLDKWRKASSEIRNVLMDNGVWDSMDLSKRMIYESNGMVKLYDKGYPLGICDSVAKTWTYSCGDFFDTRLHSSREIADAIRNYRTTGKLEIKMPQKSDKCTPRR